MTTFHCDKLCSCNTCAPVRLVIDRLDGPSEPTNRIGTRSEYAAQDALRDPAKLAELYVLALSTRGVKTSAAWSEDNDFNIAAWSQDARYPSIVEGLGIRHGERGKYVHVPWRDLSMTEARAKLLAIMQTSPNKLSREACERILKGEP